MRFKNVAQTNNRLLQFAAECDNIFWFRTANRLFCYIPQEVGSSPLIRLQQPELEQKLSGMSGEMNDVEM